MTLCAAQRGLIPRVFEELFRRLESRAKLVRPVTGTVSMADML